MAIKTLSFEQIVAQYNETIEWFKIIGVNLSTGRTIHYNNVFKYWSDNFENASEKELNQIFPDFVGSASEIHDFIDIYKSLKDVNVSELDQIINKLQRGVKGPIGAISENSNSSEARNYIFEASVAAKMHSPVDGIETIFNSKTDTGFKVEKKNIWVECKRLTSATNIEANVRKAVKQLQRHLKVKYAGVNRGVVALDYSKLLNRGDKIYVAPSDDILKVSIEDMADTFVSQYSRLLSQVYEGKNRKIIGTLIRFSTMATSEEPKLLFRVVQWGVVPRPGSRLIDQDTLKHVAKKIDIRSI